MLNLIAMQHRRANVHVPAIPGVLSKEEEAWVEPEKVDEGLEATRTASGGCLDWSVTHALCLTLIIIDCLFGQA